MSFNKYVLVFKGKFDSHILWSKKDSFIILNKFKKKVKF